MTDPPRSLSPSEQMRLLAGLMVQPFLAGAVAFVAFPVVLLDRRGHTLAGSLPGDVSDAALSVAMGAGLLAFVTLLAAAPAAVWLMKRRLVSLWDALLCGFGFGNVAFVLGTVLGGSYGVEGFLRGMAFSSLLGLTGAGVFWAIAIRGQKVDSRH